MGVRGSHARAHEGFPFQTVWLLWPNTTIRSPPHRCGLAPKPAFRFRSPEPKVLGSASGRERRQPRHPGGERPRIAKAAPAPSPPRTRLALAQTDWVHEGMPVLHLPPRPATRFIPSALRGAFCWRPRQGFEPLSRVRAWERADLRSAETVGLRGPRSGLAEFELAAPGPFCLMKDEIPVPHSPPLYRAYGGSIQSSSVHPACIRCRYCA